MDEKDELIFQIDFQSFGDRFFNNPHFKLILFLEIILLNIGIILFSIGKGLYLSLIILIIIFRTYQNKFKAQITNNSIIIPDIKFLVGKNRLKKNYEKMLGFNINKKNIKIFYKLNEEDIDEIKLNYLSENQLIKLREILINKKIKELSKEEKKEITNKTILHKLFFKILPVGIILSLILVMFIWFVIYTFILIF